MDNAQDHDLEGKRASSGNEKDEDLQRPVDWKKVSEKQVILTNWLDLKQAAYQMPDGKIYQPFYRYHKRSFVVVAARLTDGRFLCVRQYRPGIDQVTTEFPAGGIEAFDDETNPGAHPREMTALKAARRELLEETGCESDEWTPLYTTPANSTWSSDYAYLYLAENCRKVGNQQLDVTEFLQVITVTASQLDAMMRDGSFEQVTSALTWLLAKEKLGL